MAITTLDGVVAALPGIIQPYVKNALAGTFPTVGGVSLWTAPGNPTAGATPNSLTGLAPTAATAGACGLMPSSLTANGYLGRLIESASVIGYLVFYDRLSHSSNMTMTSTSAQTITSAAIPRGDTTGAGVEAMLEVYTVTGAATATTATLSYTNQAGTAARSIALTTPASVLPVGYIQQFPLASGDTGFRSVQTITLSASVTSGSAGVTLYRRIVEIPIIIAGGAVQMDVFDVGMAQLQANACIAAFYNPASTAAPAIGGSFSIIQG